jgi:hypothetical protein
MSQYNTLEKRLKHCEEQKRYRKAHPERAIAIDARFKEYRAQYQKMHPDAAKLWRKRHPDLRRRYRTNNYAIRRRLMPVKLFLNESFPESDLHHIDYQIGIYIPKWLHQSIKHSLITGYNMVQMNEAIASWLESSEKK